MKPSKALSDILDINCISTDKNGNDIMKIKYINNDEYKGPINGEELPNGIGKYTAYNKGNKLVAAIQTQWIDGIKQGDGSMYSYLRKQEHKCKWQDDFLIPKPEEAASKLNKLNQKINR